MADLAYEELYILLPDLFDLARRSSNIDEFMSAVHTEVPVAIRKVAESETSKDSKRAAHLESLAASIAALPAAPYEAPEKDETDESEVSVEAEADPQEL